jgi:hypothetical protein
LIVDDLGQLAPIATQELPSAGNCSRLRYIS